MAVLTRLPLISFCALVVATAAAFFITQALKVTTPLIQGLPRPVPSVIDPVSRLTCAVVYHGRIYHVYHGRMTISFYLQHRSDTVDVWVVNSGGTIVATLATNRRMRRNVRNPDGDFSWNGREDDGRIAPPGVYHVRVALIKQGRTVDIANNAGVLQTFTVVTKPPHPRVTSVEPKLISPTGTSAVKIRYTGTEGRGASILVYRTDLPGEPRLVKTFGTIGGAAVWDGRIAGSPAPAGVYLIGLRVTDAACNVGKFPARLPAAPYSTPGAGVTIRYLAAQPPTSPVPAGQPAVVLVDSRHRGYEWVLRRPGARRPLASGRAGDFALSVPVPGRSSGLYEVDLRAGANRTAVPLVAYGPRRTPVLVVLPALTWQGLNPGDEDGDGVPDTLPQGAEVTLARPLADGMPAGVADEASLLRYLDSVRRPYDLTTDLGLIAGVGPGLAGHRLVVLAGTEEWVTPGLASSLRSYVQAGGHVVSLGVGSLQRQVTVSGDHAVDPTMPSATDALEARPGAVVAGGSELIGELEDGLGIFRGTAGLLSSFHSYEPIQPVSPPAVVLSEAGATSTAPSVVGYRLGSGVVVDIGLPGFAAALGRALDAQQLMGRILAVLGR